MTAKCYCKSCQEAGTLLSKLEGALSPLQEDGGNLFSHAKKGSGELIEREGVVNRI